MKKARVQRRKPGGCIIALFLAALAFFFLAPLLCVFRRFADTYVFTWAPLPAIVMVMIAGAIFGGWMARRSLLSGDKNAEFKLIGSGVIGLGWSMIALSLFNWGVELSAFSGGTWPQERIEMPIVEKVGSSRSGYWLRTKSPFGPHATLGVPKPLYDRVNPNPGQECLIVRIERGKRGYVRALLDPPPELVRCTAGVRAAS